MVNRPADKDLDAASIQYANILNSIDWKPLDCQKPILRSLFGKRKKKYVFANLPRGSGKSDIGIFSLYVQSQLYPGKKLYYISFTEVNAREVIWKRMCELIPRDAIARNGFKNTDLEIHFANGSIIALKGSNADPESLRGTEPVGVVYDEFREHNEKFYNAMDASMRTPGCFVLIISTPPYKNEEAKWKLYSRVIEEVKMIPNGAYHTFTCWEGNTLPHMQEFYKEQYAKLIGMGMESEWLKEYEAKFVTGATEIVFPEFNRNCMTYHADLMAMVRSRRNLVWFIGADTSGWKRWGVMFGAIDRDTQELFWLDCIVKHGGASKEDREESGMSGYKLWPEIVTKLAELNPGSTHKDWDKVWDSQDVPIMDDINRWYGNDVHLIPVEKSKMGKAEGVGLLRDLRQRNKLFISTRCEEIINEFQGLVLNPITGQFKDEKVDLIAAARYPLHLHSWIFDIANMREPDHKFTPKEKFYNKILENDRPIKDIFPNRNYDGFVDEVW